MKMKAVIDAAATRILLHLSKIGDIKIRLHWPMEEKATTPPSEVVHAYPAKQEASLLVGR